MHDREKQFVKMPCDVLARTVLTAGAKLIFARLCDLVRAGFRPGLRRLAADCGTTPKAVGRAIKELESTRLIEVARPPGNPAQHRNAYRVRNENDIETTACSKRPRKRVRNDHASVFETTTHTDQTEPTERVLSRPGASHRPRPARTIRWSAADGWSGITDSDRSEWAAAYPVASLGEELARASAWLRANPRRATKRNWRRFIVNWLGRAQDAQRAVTPEFMKIQPGVFDDDD